MTVTLELKLPVNAITCLLPKSMLSILDFLKFPLPPPVILSKPYPSPSAYFSSDEPNIQDIQKISSIPTPPPDVVNTLLSHWHTVESTISSVQCAHLMDINPTYRLPTWVVTYWAEIYHLHKTQLTWAVAESALQSRSQSWQKPDRESHELIQQVYMTLKTLPWSGFIHGFTTQETIHHLAAYMTQEWLSDTHEIQMVELLRSAVHRHMINPMVELEGPYFHTYIKSAFEAGGISYQNLPSFSRARGLGESLQAGQHTSVGFISNVDNNHWIATVIDFSNSRILYGDSLEGEPREEFVNVLQWWTRYHTSTDFVIQKLAIPTQCDSFSCGILAFNALAHFYLPDQYPLLDVQRVADECLRIFLEVAQCHLSHAITVSSGFESTPHLEPIHTPPTRPSTPQTERGSKQLQSKSAINVALQKQANGDSVGLLKWFTKCSPDEFRAQSKHVDALITEGLKDYEEIESMKSEQRQQELQDKNRFRQQKHRQLIYATQIACGERSPGGTKQKTTTSHISSHLCSLGFAHQF
ncbi:hypothetical protein J3R83DRAFT_10486 [Lanmaoa asiatica]|nr:hypothetical protein J3R83DRAFT_10486 [Lanmaoa asiatica]